MGVTNHLLTGMILQVGTFRSFAFPKPGWLENNLLGMIFYCPVICWDNHEIRIPSSNNQDSMEHNIKRMKSGATETIFWHETKNQNVSQDTGVWW